MSEDSRIREDYVRTLQPRIEELARAADSALAKLSGGDPAWASVPEWKTLRELAHRMAGTSGTFELFGLYAVTSALDEWIQQDGHLGDSPEMARRHLEDWLGLFRDVSSFAVQGIDRWESAEIQGLLDRRRRDSGKLQQIAEGILSLVIRAQSDETAERCDLSKVAESAISRVVDVAEIRSVRIRTEFEVAAAKGTIDEIASQLEVAIADLLLDGIKSCRNGSDLIVAVRGDRVRVLCARPRAEAKYPLSHARRFANDRSGRVALDSAIAPSGELSFELSWGSPAEPKKKPG